MSARPCCGDVSEQDIAEVAAIGRTTEETMPKAKPKTAETVESTWVPGLPLATDWHAKASDFYHDNRECPVAQAVAMEQRRPGSAGRPLCPQCSGETATVPPGEYETEPEVRAAIAAAEAAAVAAEAAVAVEAEKKAKAEKAKE